MSKKVLENINNVVDKELSEYYFYNKRKREFWHSKSTTISCRVRERNEDGWNEMAINIRAFLLNEDKKFMDAMWATANKIQESDMEQIRKYVIARSSTAKSYRQEDYEKIEKNVGLLVQSLDKSEIWAALNLDQIVSCRLLGYEKEFVFLKCYSIGFLPAFVLRNLYHTKYDHSNFIQEYLDLPDNLNDPKKGLEFEYYLDKISFL